MTNTNKTKWEEQVLNWLSVKDGNNNEVYVQNSLMELIRALLKEQKEEILKIITKEIALTHSGKRGKTSGLTAAFNSIKGV